MVRATTNKPNLGARFTRRALVLSAAKAGLMGLLVSRLYDMQIVQAGKFRLLADRNRINLQPLAPSRGRIFDRHGRTLASNIEEFGLVLIPDLAGDINEVLYSLRQLIALPIEEQRRIVDVAERQSRLLPIDIEAELDWKQFARINVLAPQLPGIQSVVRARRTYANTREFGHIVGFTGFVERYEFDGDPALHLPGVRFGKAGVKTGMDKKLRGRGGYVKWEVDARGRFIRQLERIPSVSGQDIRLTMDTKLQGLVVNRLARERHAALAAINAVTGEVLSLVSAPIFDSRAIVDGLTHKEWKTLEKAPGNPMVNKAVQGQYPPGSTFKLVTALAGAGGRTDHEEYALQVQWKLSVWRAHVRLLEAQWTWRRALAPGAARVVRHLFLPRRTVARHQSIGVDGAPPRARPEF